MMPNFSNSDSSNQHNNTFFPDNAFGDIDGFLSNGGGDYDSSWAFGSNQFDVSGNSGSSWQSAPAHQPAQTFRPGAHPDQLFSQSLTHNTGHGHNINYGPNSNAFGGFAPQQYSSSTISPSNLNQHPGPVQVRVPAPSSGFGNAGTIAPEALQSRATVAAPNYNNAPSFTNPYPAAPTFTSASGKYSEVPRGGQIDKFSVIATEHLQQSTSVKTKQVSPFAEVGLDVLELRITESKIPEYFPRKSRNEIKRLLASDSNLVAKINKKVSKKTGAPRAKAIPSRLDASGKLTTQAPKREESSSSDEETTDDSDSEYSDEEEEKGPPIPATRPTTPKEATRYDTIKSLWRPKDSVVTAQSIRDGLKSFHEILSTIKDRWRSDSNAVKEAETQKKVNEISMLKDRVTIQRNLLQVALSAAVEHGHRDIVDHFGTSAAAVGILAVFLQDRAKESDYDSALTLSILQFLSRCKMLDNGLLEKSAVGKLLPRFSKRGTDRVKQLARTIETNAIAASKKKKESLKSSGSGTGSGKDSKPSSGIQSPPSTAGVKRPRPSDASGDQPLKKPSAKAGDAQGVKKPAASGATGVGAKAGGSSTSTANKGSSNPVVAKSSSFISSLQSAKRPSAAKGVNGPAKAAPKSSQPSSSSTSNQPFSFASVLADVSRPKEEVPKEKKQDDKIANETPAQRAKRLKKEARRGLHVHFKPADTLVEVRVFEHDPEEELGHDASQMRDVTDVGSEGKMFKLHQQHHEMMDIEDDEEDLQSIEQAWKPWSTPTDVDFSEVPEEARTDNFIPFGGGLKEPDCPEKKTQEEREATVMLALYTNSEDIPPSPNEPSDDTEGMSIDAKPFGELVEGDPIKQRLEEVKNIQPRPRSPPDSAPQVDINAILAQLSGVGGPTPAVPMMQPQQPQQPPPPPQQPPPQDLASIINAVAAGNQPQAPAPQMSMQQPDMSAVLGAINQPNTQQQPQQSQALPNPQMDLSSILASLQQNNTNQPDQQVQQPTMGMPFFPPTQTGMPNMQQMDNSYSNQTPEYMQQMMSQAHQFAMSGMPNMGSMDFTQQQQQQSGQPYENDQRRQFRNQGSNDQGAAKFKKSGKVDPSTFFTQPCKFFREGKCTKGASCTYRHDDG